ncbi:MAG: tetratricopeptide repeat protein [Woeseiaceae bacterium]
MNSELLHGFHLGDLHIDPVRGQVSGRGRSEHLTPKAAEVLLCLAHQPGELVTREELLETVWGAGQGSQEALGHAISDIRHALDDHADNPEFIQTLPKRGFRLLQEPVPDDATGELPVAPASANGFWRRMIRRGVIQASAAYLVAGWLLIQVADITFANIGLPHWSEQFVTFVVICGFPIVVLLAWYLEYGNGLFTRDRGTQRSGLFRGLERNYATIFVAYGLSAIGVGTYHALIGFESPQSRQAIVEHVEDAAVPVLANSLAALKLISIGGDDKSRAFAEGLSEDILDGLVRIPGLKVSARGDSWSMPPNASSEQVRRRLRVAHYLEGSIRFFDDKLRVVVQLIDSDSGFHVFSRSFEIELGGINDMQKEITKLVVANLKPAVDPDSLNLDSMFLRAPSDDAYYLYQLGREALNRPSSVDNINEALDYFDQALDFDDQYPVALAERCRAFVVLYRLNPDSDAISSAESACAQAIYIAPRLPVVLNNTADLYRRTGRSGEAEDLYQQVLNINAQDATAMRGLAQIRRRDQRFDEAESLMQEAIDLQPGNWSAINGLGNMYFGLGRYADAIDEYKKVVYLNPQNYITLGNMASANMMLGNFGDARDALRDSIAIEENATFQSNLGIAHYYLGDFSASVVAHRRAVELAPDSAGNWIGLADALYFSGDETSAQDAYVTAKLTALEQLSVSPDDIEALMYLAWSAAMTNDIDAAAAHAQRIVEMGPADPYSHYFDALVKLKAGDPDAAIDALGLSVETGYPLAMLAAEPILREIKDDRRFERLLVRTNN